MTACIEVHRYLLFVLAWLHRRFSDRLLDHALRPSRR
jgi:hypothetical protein